jgi:HD-GYP domain-containing protein (c-di-GMP phosphodiesterase class II)
MYEHTVVGERILEAVPELAPVAPIVRHVRERWDGTGYPDRLAGVDIPLVARLVAVADVYDALRSRRVYKPGLSHHTAVLTMTEGSPGHFDPALVEVFRRVAGQFDHIFRDLGE